MTAANTQAEPRPTAKNIYTLAELLTFDLPTLHHYNPALNEWDYAFDGAADELECITFATQNAADLLGDGIEAVTDLLLTVEINQAEFEFHVNGDTRINALALVAEMSRMVRAVHKMEEILNRVRSTNQPAQKNPEL